MTKARDLFAPRLIARTLVLCAVALASTLGGGACQPSAKPPESVAPPVDHELPEGPLADVVASLCETLHRCPKALKTPFVFRTRQECLAALNFRITCDAALETGVNRVPLEMEAASASDCIEWLETASCTELNDLDSGGPCDAAIAQTASARVSKARRAEEEREEAAEQDDPPNAIGEPCPCEPAAYCKVGSVDIESGTQSCSTCSPRLKVGEACTHGACEAGHVCRRSGEALVCTALEPVGGPCFQHEQCQSGFCDDTLSVGTGRCAEDGYEGDACEKNSDCRGSGWNGELFCAEDNTCQPPRRNGAPCSNLQACADTRCDMEAGVCGAPDGDSCTRDIDCANNACVDYVCKSVEGACFYDEECGAGEVCATRCPRGFCNCRSRHCKHGSCKRVGEGGCLVDSDCPPGNDCRAGACFDWPQLGDSCSYEPEWNWSSDSCDPHQCVNGFCAAKGGPGDACDRPNGCVAPYICIAERCEIMNLTCEPAAVGRRCAGGVACQDGAYCDTSDSGLCKLPAKLGQECQLIDKVESCEKGATCEPDPATGNARCAAIGTSGEACVEGKCEAGLYCHDEVCAPDPVGRQCGSPELADCPDGHYCSNSVCLPVTPGGGECRRNTSCAEGFFCGGDGICEARLPEGAVCQWHPDCQPQLYCEGNSSTCVPRLEKGEPCPKYGYVDECAPGLVCSLDEVCDHNGQHCQGWCVEAQCVRP